MKEVSILDKLTNKQRLFADEYLIDLNASRAYKAIYKSCKKDETARVNGSKLLTNTNVSNYISKRMKEREKRTEITQDRVLKEYAKIAFFNPKDLFDKEGKPKDITELDNDTAAVIAGLKVNDVYEGFGEDRTFIGYLKEYKIADKKGALDSLARHLGMFNDKLEVNGQVDINNPFEGLTTEELKKLIQDD